MKLASKTMQRPFTRVGAFDKFPGCLCRHPSRRDSQAEASTVPKPAARESSPLLEDEGLYAVEKSSKAAKGSKRSSRSSKSSGKAQITPYIEM